MATGTTNSSAPMPFYDIHRKDYVNQDYQVQVNNGFNTGSEESFYPMSLNEVQATAFQYPPPFQHPNRLAYFQPQMGLAPTFRNGVTYNGGMAPTFQPHPRLPYFQTSAPSFTTVPSSASSSSTLPQHPLTPSPPLRKEVQKAKLKSKSSGKHVTRNATQSTKRELLAPKPRRKRGPNKRPPGTAFLNLLDGLPNEVKEALEMDYRGCCETINIKDISTKQKHMFSIRHCRNLPSEYQEQVPNFVCPAFIALKSNCGSKAGRYDSTERHCNNCVGYDQLNKGSKGASPVVITRAQYNVIKNYRIIRAESEGKEQATDQSTEQARALAHITLANVFKDGFPDWFPLTVLGGESNERDAIVDATSQPPTGTNTTSVPGPVADHFEQPPPSEPSIFHHDTVNECAEAFMNGFVDNNHHESNVSDTIVDAAAQSPTMSAPSPVMNHFEQYSFYEPPPFDSESAKECAEAFTNGFAMINHQDEFNVSDVIIDAAAPPSFMSAPDPVANHFEQSSFHELSPSEMEKFDESEWDRFLSDLLQRC
ncbi:hypothetical protein F5888DRAFT_1633073 [Russula emetica]|nr:hypothetical protein F5888DRAFT_1633073 [Russula emetica]